MIFVTVGTTDFDLLVEEMDRLAPSLGEEVIAQIGRGAYQPRNMEFFRFAPSLEPYYSRARVVVAHGGLGTIIEVMERGMKLIGVSNPDRYDHHQEDILGTLARRGHMLWCRDLRELPEAVRSVNHRTFLPYEAPSCEIAEHIRRYLGLPENGREPARPEREPGGRQTGVQ